MKTFEGLWTIAFEDRNTWMQPTRLRNCTDLVIDESSPWCAFTDAQGRRHFVSGTVHIEEQERMASDAEKRES